MSHKTKPKKTRAVSAEHLEAIKDIAHLLHERYCSWNHTDGCSWGYEGSDWSGRAHKEWLEEARELTPIIVRHAKWAGLANWW